MKLLAKQHSPGWHQEAELLCASFQCLSTHESCKIYIPAFCCPLERMKHISRCGIHKKDPVHQWTSHSPVLSLCSWHSFRLSVDAYQGCFQRSWGQRLPPYTLRGRKNARFTYVPLAQKVHHCFCPPSNEVWPTSLFGKPTRTTIVFDGCHVMALMNQIIINTLQRDQPKELDRLGRPPLKENRFLLLRNYDSLDLDHKARLDNLLQVNQPLFVIHLSKQSFNSINLTTISNLSNRGRGCPAPRWPFFYSTLRGPWVNFESSCSVGDWWSH